MRCGKVRIFQGASESAICDVNLLASNRRLQVDPGGLHWKTVVVAQIPGVAIYMPQVNVPFGYQIFSITTYSCCSCFFWWQRKRKVGRFSVYGSFYGNHLLLAHFLYGATLNQSQLRKSSVHHTVAYILKDHGKKQLLSASRLFYGNFQIKETNNYKDTKKMAHVFYS